VDIRAKLKQSETDRETLEARLLSHYNKVSQTMNQVQEWEHDEQDEREPKRPRLGPPKRNAAGTAKTSTDGVGTFAISSSVAGPINPLPYGGNDGRAIAPSQGLLPPSTINDLADLSDSGSGDFVPSSSRSSSVASPDHSDIDAK
jgi:hypothetical protein